MAYFMHLRFERLNLVMTIVPAVVILHLPVAGFSPTVFARKTCAISEQFAATTGC